MNSEPARAPRIAIACGGTGGHLFPGLAVAERFVERGCPTTLFISSKEVDRQSIAGASGMEVVALPAVGLGLGRIVSFAHGFLRSLLIARRQFRIAAPSAVLAMGGFTSGPTLLAAKSVGAQTYLHESNSVPGRANRWLSWLVDAAFTGFLGAAQQLHCSRVTSTGTPVRREFQPLDAPGCRLYFGLQPERPTVLVMGGSQGASAINRLLIDTLPLIRQSAPEWQWLHLTGPKDSRAVSDAYAAAQLRAVVLPFCHRMELALGSATAAVSRAGASSLSEFAAMRVPAVLIPFPAAADNHQFHNARAWAQSGAACLLEQAAAAPQPLFHALRQILQKPAVRTQMQEALGSWHRPHAAEEIASAMLQSIGVERSPGRASVQRQLSLGIHC